MLEINDHIIRRCIDYKEGRVELPALVREFSALYGWNKRRTTYFMSVRGYTRNPKERVKLDIGMFRNILNAYESGHLSEYQAAKLLASQASRVMYKHPERGIKKTFKPPADLDDHIRKYIAGEYLTVGDFAKAIGAYRTTAEDIISHIVRTQEENLEIIKSRINSPEANEIIGRISAIIRGDTQ